MRKGLKISAACVVGLGFLYYCGPISAGFFEIGDSAGPRLYPEDLHTRMYVFAYEARTGQKPERSARNVLYDRPLFYGQDRPPKSMRQRYAIQANAEVRKLPIKEQLREWNLEIDNEDNESNGGDAEPFRAPPL